MQEFAKRQLSRLEGEFEAIKDRTDGAAERKRTAIVGKMVKWQRIAWRG